MKLTDKIHPKFIGMDLETSGTEPRKKPLPAVPIQIGVAAVNGNAVGIDIGWPDGTYELDPESIAINRFTPERIRDAAPEPEASAFVKQWLAERVDPEREKFHVVGWNVGSFDLQFVNEHMPNLRARFHRRSVDLNAVAYTVAAVTGRNSDKLKEQSKRFASAELARQGQAADWHDAMYDAKAALWSWYWFIDYIGGLEYLHGALGERLSRGER